MRKKQSRTTSSLLRSGGSLAPRALDTSGKLVYVSPKVLTPSPQNPRASFNSTAAEELVASVQEQGILEPLIVRPGTKEGTYEIVAGHRRWQAAKVAHLTEIPCVVRKIDDEQLRELMLVENLQREDLAPLEEAAAIAELLKKSPADDVARKIGKSRSWVFARAQILKMPKEVQNEVQGGKIKPSHVELLAQMKDERRLTDAARGVAGGYISYDLLKEKVRGDELARAVADKVIDMKASGFRVLQVGSIENVAAICTGSRVPRKVSKPVKISWQYERREISVGKVNKLLDEFHQADEKRKCAIGIVVEKAPSDIHYRTVAKKPRVVVAIVDQKLARNLAGFGKKIETQAKEKEERQKEDREHKARIAELGHLQKRIREKIGTFLPKDDKGMLLDMGISILLDSHHFRTASLPAKLKASELRKRPTKDLPAILLRTIALSRVLKRNEWHVTEEALKDPRKLARILGVQTPDPKGGKRGEKRTARRARRKK
jgi:ParB family chromosome partitioning protein